MGRSNRSRKRHDEMNRAKRVRYAAKELIQLKKTLGIIDGQGNELMQEISEVAVVKSAKDLKREKKIQEEKEILEEITSKDDPGEKIAVINEKTGKKHVYNTKTMKDENGAYPPWYKPKNTLKRQRKLDHARKLRFKQAWTTLNVPL